MSPAGSKPVALLSRIYSFFYQFVCICKNSHILFLCLFTYVGILPFMKSPFVSRILNIFFDSLFINFFHKKEVKTQNSVVSQKFWTPLGHFIYVSLYQVIKRLFGSYCPLFTRIPLFTILYSFFSYLHYKVCKHQSILPIK